MPRGLERKRVGVLPLAATIFFVVSGGPYTAEQVVGKSGPLCGLLILALLPLVWSLPVGLMTAELSARFPEEGGYYVWVKSALGPFAGFLCAWWSWTSSWVDLALYPLVAVQYAGRFAGTIDHSQFWVLGVIAFFTLWNLLGIRTVGRLSNYLFWFILGCFVILVGFGLKSWVTHPPSHLPLFNGPAKWDGVGAAIVFGLWNYFGWDSLTSASGEIDSSSRQFPRAIFWAQIMVGGLVVLPIAAGIVLKTNWSDWAGDAGYWPEIAQTISTPLRNAIIVGGVLSNFGLFAANLLASSRIPYVLSNDRYLPKWISREHPKFGTPWVAILIGAAISALLARESLEKLVAVDLSLYLFALVLELISLVLLRRTAKKEKTFAIGGGRIGLGLCVTLPILVAGTALVLQLSPSTKVSELPITPIFLLLLFSLSAPIYFGLWKLHQTVTQK